MTESGRPRPLAQLSRTFWRCAAVAMVAALSCTFPFAAQPEVILCLSPEAPVTALPEDVLAEYRAEIATEFEAYFGEVSDYIACLDEERARALAKARATTDAYSTFLTTIPAPKDLP